MEKCEYHEKEIKRLQDDFNKHKLEINDRLEDFMDEILERIKPQFSTSQITGFLISVIGMMSLAVLFVGSVDSRSINNERRIEKQEETNELILEKLNVIAVDVAVTKAEIKKK